MVKKKTLFLGFFSATHLLSIFELVNCTLHYEEATKLYFVLYGNKPACINSFNVLKIILSVWSKAWRYLKYYCFINTSITNEIVDIIYAF